MKNGVNAKGCIFAVIMILCAQEAYYCNSGGRGRLRGVARPATQFHWLAEKSSLKKDSRNFCLAAKRREIENN